MRTGIIYIATCKENNKVYVGQSINTLKVRISGHVSDANNRCKTHFHRAVKKYGRDGFVWKVVLDNVAEDKLDIEEMCLIFLLDTYYTGYNSSLGGEINPTRCPKVRAKISKTLTGRKHSATTKNKRSLSLLGRPSPRRKLAESQVLEIVEMLKTYPDSYIAKQFNLSKNTVGGIRIGKSWGHLTKIKHIKTNKGWLSKETVLNIIEELKLGNKSQEQIARDFNTSQGSVSSIAVGKTYTKVKK